MSSPQQADQPTPERIKLIAKLRAEAESLPDAYVDAFKAEQVSDLLREAATALASPTTADWITLEVERALYLDDGREVVLCDRLPSPVKLLLKLASASPPTAPEGDWVLSPREPTDAMNSAGFAEWNRTRAGSVDLIYRAMLASAPPPPQPQEWREQAARVLGSFPMHDEDRGPDNEVLVDVLPYTPGEVMSGETVLYRIVDALCARLGPPPQAGIDIASRDPAHAVSAVASGQPETGGEP